MYHAAASITKIYLNKYFDCENDWATGFKSVNFEYIDHSFASEKAISSVGHTYVKSNG